MGVVAGVDACKGGWVAVVTDDGRFAKSLLAPSLSALLSEIPEASAVGIDMPIGLPVTGHREADIEARRFVGPRRSSVFPTPPREALVAPTYEDARRLVPSLSAQSYALRMKILEVEACLESRVFEVHPEVSFAALAERHLPFPKRSWNGQAERRGLLAGAGILLPDELDAGMAPSDDVLDAAVAAWSAGRKADGRAMMLPNPPAIVNGREVAIWY